MTSDLTSDYALGSCTFLHCLARSVTHCESSGKLVFCTCAGWPIQGLSLGPAALQNDEKSM